MSEANSQECMIITTVNDENVKTKIIDGLLNENLAACVQVMPIQSYYKWKGKVNKDQEELLMIKTQRSLYEPVEAYIRQYHSYEVPEIIQLSVEHGFFPYLQWIRDNTNT